LPPNVDPQSGQKALGVNEYKMLTPQFHDTASFIDNFGTPVS